MSSERKNYKKKDFKILKIKILKLFPIKSPRLKIKNAVIAIINKSIKIIMTGYLKINQR